MKVQAKEFNYYKEPFDVTKNPPERPKAGHINQFKEYELRLTEWNNIRAAGQVNQHVRRAVVVFDYGDNGSLAINPQLVGVTISDLISAIEVLKYNLLKQITSPEQIKLAEKKPE
jgi:hypothetical protein